MRRGTLDLMIETSVACLAADDHHDIAKLVCRLARRWPGEPALSIAFALTSAAAAVEDVVDTENAAKAAQHGYRLAALVAADIFAVESMGQAPATGHDLLHFWRRVDPYFLNL